MITLYKPTHRAARTVDALPILHDTLTVMADVRASSHGEGAHRLADWDFGPTPVASHCWTTGRANTPAHVCTSSFCAKHSSTGVL